MLKLATIAYVPPPRPHLHPAAFLINLGMFKRAYPLVLFSDYPWEGRTVELTMNPERVAHVRKNKYALANLLFFKAAQVALAQDITHFLYLESDCRVGCDEWDARVFNEYFDAPLPVIAGGTLAVWNPQGGGASGVKRWEELTARNLRKNFPVASYSAHADEKSLSAVFPIGAPTIYETAWLGHLFPLQHNTVTLANQGGAFDFEFGKRIWGEFGATAYDMVAHLSSVFSGESTTDRITTEEGRLRMLRNKEVAIVHPIKSGAA